MKSCREPSHQKSLLRTERIVGFIQDHELVRPLQPIADGQGIEQQALAFCFAATSHIALLACLIHKHAWSELRAFWPTGGLKDRPDFDFSVHIPGAFAFVLFKWHTASPQPG